MTWSEKVEELLGSSDYLKQARISIADTDLSQNEDSFVVLNHGLIDDLTFIHEVNRVCLVYPDDTDFKTSLLFSHLIGNLCEEEDAKLQVKDLHIGNKLKAVGDKNSVAMLVGFADDNCKLVDNPNTATLFKLSFKDKEAYSYLPIGNYLPYLFKADPDSKLSRQNDFHKNLNASKNHSDEQQSVSSILRSRLHDILKSSVYITDTQQICQLLPKITRDGMRVGELLTISRIKDPRDDSVSVENLGAIGNSVELYLAPSLFSLGLFKDENQSVKFNNLYIDVDNIDLSDFSNYIDSVDYLFENIIILTRESTNGETLQAIKSTGFQFFAWNPSLLMDDVSPLPDIKERTTLQNYRNRSITAYLVEEDPFTSLSAKLSKLKEFAEAEDPAFSRLYKSLLAVIYYFLQEGFDISKEIVLQRIDSITEQMILADEVKHVFNAQAKQELLKIGDDLLRLLKEDEKKKRGFLVSCLPEILNDSQKTRLCFLLRDEEIDSAKAFIPPILNQLSKDNYSASFVTRNRFWESEEIYDVVIMMYWSNAATMKQILLSNKAPDYRIFTYGIERIWLQAALRSWNSFAKEPCTVLEEVDMPQPVDAIFLKIKGHQEAETQITDFPSEVQLRKDRFLFSKKTYPNSSDSVETKEIGFNDGTSAYYPLGFSFTEIVLNELTGEIVCKQAYCEDLKLGSIVMFYDSNKDVITSKAEQILDSWGKSNASEIARRWKDSLSKQKIYGNDYVFNKLRQAGVHVSDQTVRIWLDEDSPTILPKHAKEKLQKIALAFDDNDLMEDIDEILKAGSIVRSARVTAGKELSAQVKRSEEVVRRLQRLAENDDMGLKEEEIKLGGVGGNITILSVCDISDSTVNVPLAMTKRRE